MTGQLVEIDALQYSLRSKLDELLESRPALRLALIGHGRSEDELLNLWLSSDYLVDVCTQHPQILLQLLLSGHLYQKQLSEQEFGQVMQELCSAINVPAQEWDKSALRMLRKREYLRILWRERLGISSLEDTCHALTALAEFAIRHCLKILEPLLQARYGEPLALDGSKFELLVIAMGKLGAYELNLSSDIDLIFAFTCDEKTQETTVSEKWKILHPRAKPCPLQHFFVTLGQQLVVMLDQHTGDGIVFRTDMRLRPYGSTGAMAISLDALEEYYLTQGRTWERFALIKARAVTGSPHAQQALYQILNPFIYRGYTDFSTFDALRDIKRKIETQVRKKGIQANLKLGSGGIREIEFCVQVLQLIHGGKQRSLQRRELRAVLKELVNLGLFPEEQAQSLLRAYELLRRTEHAAQALEDKQTHEWPEDALKQTRMALSLGYRSSASLQEELEQNRIYVAKIFAELINSKENEEEGLIDNNKLQSCIDIWQELSEDPGAFLSRCGFLEPGVVLQACHSYRRSKQYLALEETSRERIDTFMPRLFYVLCEDNNLTEKHAGFHRVFNFVQAVQRRSAYLLLLLENSLALQQLIFLSTTSSWVNELLIKYPILLDELLRPLREPVLKVELQQQVQQRMLTAAQEDLDEQLLVLQNFRQEQMLLVAAAELYGTLPLMKVSDYLTWLAETIVSVVIDLAWQQLVKRYGLPFDSQGNLGDREFLVVGYGKLGGLELSYRSDLDLVFIHDGHADAQTSGGSYGTCNSSAFYVQLGQKILSFLNTQTQSGKLYEIDMRLRPSGASGALVTTLTAFQTYQVEQAWTWEHQALVRARAICGSAALREDFEKVRKQILAMPRDLFLLATQVAAMRARMLRVKKKISTINDDNLKLVEGGIIDIEFIVQYLVLREGHSQPQLLQWSDNVRLLDCIAQLKLLPAKTAQLLQQTYLDYRRMRHQLILNTCAVIEDTLLMKKRSEVVELWGLLFSEIPIQELSAGSALLCSTKTTTKR
jgi:glutamate-ammonia-ligase adenylyltransferase